MKVADGDHVVPGERAVVELLDAAAGRVRRVLLSRDLPEVERLAQAHGVEVQRVEDEQIADVVEVRMARGVVAIAKPPRLHELDDLLEAAAPADGARTILVALDGVVDPHNLGAILRSAEFFGCQGAFWAKDRAAPVSPVAVRASAGATERLMCAEVTNLARALEQAKQAGFWVVGTVADDDARSLYDLLDSGGCPDRVVLVMGSEGAGLRRLTRDRCDLLVTLPRRGQLGSLNVSAATAAALSALVR